MSSQLLLGFIVCFKCGLLACTYCVFQSGLMPCLLPHVAPAVLKELTGLLTCLMFAPREFCLVLSLQNIIITIVRFIDWSCVHTCLCFAHATAHVCRSKGTLQEESVLTFDRVGPRDGTRCGQAWWQASVCQVIFPDPFSHSG